MSRFREEVNSSVSGFGWLPSGALAVSASCLHLTPAKDVRLNCLPCCPVPPLAVYALTREWKDVCSNMILSQSLDRQPRAWISVSYEVLQTSISCHHALAPIYSDASVNQSGAASERTRTAWRSKVTVDSDPARGANCIYRALPCGALRLLHP